jgi:nitrogen regulatory protein PII
VRHRGGNGAREAAFSSAKDEKRHKGDTMKKIEAIIRPTKAGDVYAALGGAGRPGLMISEIEGQGRRKGVEREFRGKKYKTELLAKAKIEIVADDDDVDRIVSAIQKAAMTGKEGDGRIFVYNIEDTVRIRTGERAKTLI